MATSDLPYVQGPTSRERSNPVFPVGIVDWTDRSGSVAQAAAAFELFPVAGEDVTSRFIAHVGVEDSGSLWVNFLGGNAAANAPGSIELIPGDILSIPTRAAVSMAGTEAGINYTAAEG